MDGDEEPGRVLRRRYGKVQSRDFFHVGEELDVSGALAQVAEELHRGGLERLAADIQGSTGELYRQFIALFRQG